jgi:glyoxylase-like metal-dependent hydrolase (beta-lactamase superfamily II)
VGLFTERGGTIGWFMNDDALLVVDTQYPETAGHCHTGLQERSEQSLDLVVNTHHHGDHTGGNGVFAEHTDRIVGHANVPELQRQSADEAERPVVPTTTFEESWSEDLGGETLRLQHYGPAHTGGDTVVAFENANIVHMGDLVFNRAYPFIDVGGGADSQNWITTLETVHAAYDDETIFIHGHGNPEFGITGSRADLLVMRDFLAALNEYVRKQRQQGASLAEMKETEVLGGFSDFNFDWALSLGNCIEAVYREQTEG